MKKRCVRATLVALWCSLYASVGCESETDTVDGGAGDGGAGDGDAGDGDAGGGSNAQGGETSIPTGEVPIGIDGVSGARIKQVWIDVEIEIKLRPCTACWS